MVYGWLMQTGTVVKSPSHVAVWNDFTQGEAWSGSFEPHSSRRTDYERFEPFWGRLPRSEPYLRSSAGSEPFEVRDRVVVRFVMPDSNLGKIRIPIKEAETDSVVELSLKIGTGRRCSRRLRARAHLERSGALEIALPAQCSAGHEGELTVHPVKGRVTLYRGSAGYPFLSSTASEELPCAIEFAHRVPLAEKVHFVVARSVELIRRGEFRRLVRAAVIRAVMVGRRVKDSISRRG
jgi:hypothetical protein